MKKIAVALIIALGLAATAVLAEQATGRQQGSQIQRTTPGTGMGDQKGGQSGGSMMDMRAMVAQMTKMMQQCNAMMSGMGGMGGMMGDKPNPGKEPDNK